MNKNIPKLRFEELTDGWEQHKLGDYLKNSEKVKANIQSKDDLMTLKLNLGGLESGSNRETLELGSTTYYKRKAGQFIYGKQNFFNGSMAIIPIDLDGKATSGDVPSLEVVGISSEYLYFYVSRRDYWKSKEAKASGTGSKRIHEKTLQDFDIKVPSTEDEQQKIGSFFKQLDENIALHQRKLDLLEEQKKGFLQKMFPKYGEKVPELRFEGFTDAWEQRKLGNLGFVAMNKRIFKDQTSEHGEIPFFKIGTFGGTPDAFISRKLFEEYKVKYPYPEIGDILISASGSIGRTVVYQGKDEYFQDSNIVWLKHDNQLDNKFLKQFYSIVKWQGLEGSTIKRLYNKNIHDTAINIPNVEEQNKIGSFFEKLDNTITLHQSKLDLLKEQKKAFLQQMFI